MEGWYAVQTKPRQEGVAEQNLLRQSFKTYLPRIQLSKRRRGAWKEVVEPLFQSYLFLSIDPDQDNTAPIRSTRGVIGLVRFGSQLKPISDSIIQYLKQNENPESGLYELDMPQFQKGDSIQIVEGVLTGLNGIYQTQKGEDRALILVNILGKQSEVTLKQHAITSLHGS